MQYTEMYNGIVNSSTMQLFNGSICYQLILLREIRKQKSTHQINILVRWPPADLKYSDRCSDYKGSGFLFMWSVGFLKTFWNPITKMISANRKRSQRFVSFNVFSISTKTLFMHCLWNVFLKHFFKTCFFTYFC